MSTTLWADDRTLTDCLWAAVAVPLDAGGSARTLLAPKQDIATPVGGCAEQIAVPRFAEHNAKFGRRFFL